MKLGKLTSLLAATLLMSCNDRQVVAPSAAPSTPPGVAPTASLQRIDCSARLDTKVIRCGAPTSGVNADVVIGGQNQYVTLTSSNVVYDGGTELFTFDVTVTNLIPQPLGTTNGTSSDGVGLRLFFHSGPTITGGTGVATVANPTGTATFTATNQPYFQYSAAELGADGILSQNETSLALPWALNISSTVTSFTFSVYVSANVRYPNGYVDVTSPSPFLLQTATQSVAATSRTMVGNAVPGSTMTYSSTAPAIATVNTSGVVTAVAPGIATIDVTSSESTTGAVTVQVCPNLAVGEVYTTSGAGSANVCFGGAAAVSEYTIIPLNTASSTLSMGVTGVGIQAVSGPPTPTKMPTSIVRTSDAEGTAAMQRVREYASAEWQHGPSATDDDTAEAEGVVPTSGSRQRLKWYPTASVNGTVPAPVPFATEARSKVSLSQFLPGDTIGDIRSINTSSACSGSPVVRTGVVLSISAHAIIVADIANPAGGFTTAQYDSIALEFDTIAYAVDSQYFSPPTDIDNNQRVILFFTKDVNQLNPAATTRPINGFWASKDVFGRDDCSNSNGEPTAGAEILYMLVPDPTGSVNANVQTVSAVRSKVIMSAGHELQHLINGFARAYVTGASFFEAGWLNEALSLAAEELMFYRTAPGLAPRMNIDLPALTTGPDASRRSAAFSDYESNAFTLLRPWLQRPDTARFVSGNTNSQALRGFGGMFLRYAADRMNIGDEIFFRRLVTSNLEGLPNIQNAIGGAVPYDWIRDFQIALYADDNAFAVAPQYQTQSWNLRSAYPAASGSFPLLARSLTNGVPLSLSYAAGGGSSFLRFGVPAGAFAQIAASSAGVPVASTARLSYLRTK